MILIAHSLPVSRSTPHRTTANPESSGSRPSQLQPSPLAPKAAIRSSPRRASGSQGLPEAVNFFELAWVPVYPPGASRGIGFFQPLNPDASCGAASRHTPTQEECAHFLSGGGTFSSRPTESSFGSGLPRTCLSSGVLADSSPFEAPASDDPQPILLRVRRGSHTNPSLSAEVGVWSTVTRYPPPISFRAALAELATLCSVPTVVSAQKHTGSCTKKRLRAPSTYCRESSPRAIRAQSARRRVGVAYVWRAEKKGVIGGCQGWVLYIRARKEKGKRRRAPRALGVSQYAQQPLPACGAGAAPASGAPPQGVEVGDFLSGERWTTSGPSRASAAA